VAAAIPTNYVFIKTVQTRPASADLITETNAAAKAEAVFTDGSYATIDLAISKDSKYDKPVSGGTISNIEVGTLVKTNVNSWFAYVKNDDGTYTLSELNSNYAKQVSQASLALAANSATNQYITDKSSAVMYLNSATVVTGLDFNETTKVYDITTVKGIPTKEVGLGSGYVLYTYAKDSTTVANIYTMQAVVTSTEVPSYAVCVEAGQVTSDGTQWTFSIDGQLVTYTMSATTNCEAKAVVTLTESNGKYAASSTTATKSDAVVKLVDGKTIVVYESATNTTYTMSDTCGVYNLTDNATVIGEKDTLEVGDHVSVYVNAGTDKVDAIFITTEASAE
jgi:hypothetical protein